LPSEDPSLVATETSLTREKWYGGADKTGFVMGEKEIG